MWGIRDGTQAVPDNDKDVVGVAEGVKLSGLLGGLSVFSHSLTVFDFAFCALAASRRCSSGIPGQARGHALCRLEKPLGSRAIRWRGHKYGGAPPPAFPLRKYATSKGEGKNVVAIYAG